MSTNVIPFSHLTGHLPGNAQYTRQGKTSPHTCPFYMGTEPDPLGLILSIPRLASFDGTIYNALSENLLILTIVARKIYIIPSCP
jgi:hypothetical protein